MKKTYKKFDKTKFVTREPLKGLNTEEINSFQAFLKDSNYPFIYNNLNKHEN